MAGLLAHRAVVSFFLTPWAVVDIDPGPMGPEVEIVRWLLS